ncbi:IS30 family transposase [Flavobacteriales bacterium]|nr:IS30 family transposase [Flavobacteriales bacterium]
MAHITNDQRYTISRMLKSGYTQSSIAVAIEKDKSVVSREIKRNSDSRSGEYRYELAKRKCSKRHEEKRKNILFTLEVKSNVNELLQEDYSPEQIVGYLKKQGKSCVSTERIYQYIWKDKKDKGDLYLHLRNQGKRYRKRGAKKDNRGIIKDRIGIEKRPEVVDKRERFGDIEVDLIIGKQNHQAMPTINDRASGMVKIRKVESKQAKEISRVMIEALEDWAPYIKTITSDNGKEFADHQFVSEQLGVDYFFTRPYHSWERGSNENLNGLIRQYFKKSSDFSTITDQQVMAIENILNMRLRKRFKYETPIFVMDKLLFNDKLHL